MRALTSKEKKLLIGMVAALFVLLNVVGVRIFLNRQHTFEANITRLTAQLAQNKAILSEKDYWAERAAWLEKNQPEDDVTTIEDDTKFTDFVETSAKNAGLEYMRKGGGPLPAKDSYAEVYDSSQVKGTMQQLVKWLYELQQPKAFRAIKQLRIKSGEPPQVIADIEVARWYRAVGGDGGSSRKEDK